MTVNYVYLGYGVTDSTGKAVLDHDANGNALSHSYTGTGAGEIDIIASLDSTITESSLVSETYELLDCIYYNPNDLTSETQINKNIGTGDFCVEWDLKATSRTASYSYVRLGTDYNNCIQIGHLFSTGSSVIRVIQNGNQINASSSYTVPLDTDVHVVYTRIGNNHTLKLNETTLTLTDSTYSNITLLQAVVTDETEDLKNLKVYPI